MKATTVTKTVCISKGSSLKHRKEIEKAFPVRLAQYNTTTHKLNFRQVSTGGRKPIELNLCKESYSPLTLSVFF